MKTRVGIILTSIIFWLIGCQPSHETADIIISGTVIWTGNDQQPVAEAMAIKGDRILAIGTLAEIAQYSHNETKQVNAAGKFITPGFIDSHVHLLRAGHNLTSVQLRNAASKTAFINRIAAYAKSIPAGTWITGGDWDHENWGGELPSREWIDSVTTNHPVFITRLDGHMSLANTRALELAEVDANIADIEGGAIGRNESGYLTGIFKDNATSVIYEKMPDYSDMQKAAALDTAMAFLASRGITSIHDMSASMEVYQKAYNENRLITRIYAIWPLAKWEELNKYIEKNGKGNKWLRSGGLKGFVDGSLGSHTAAFMSGYSDMPADSGFLVNSENDLYNSISNADKAELQVMVHSIGDRAINVLLNIYEQVEQENGTRDRRFRIEHAQHIAPTDISRFGAMNIIPSMQPYHAIDDGRWAEKLIGPERIKTTYAFRSLLDNGARMAFGSDWFVAPPSPMKGIYAAVTRRTLDDANPDGWIPEQKITVEEALTAYTRNAAYAGFQENETGSLEPGKLADFVILNKNILKIDPVKIWDTEILETWVGGKNVYKKRK